MKILLLIESAGAGAGRHVADLAEGLAASGHSVHLAYNSARTDALFRARLASIGGKLDGVVGMPMRHSVHPADVRTILRLRAYLRTNGPFDIVHCHSTKAGLLGRAGLCGAGAAVIYTPHAPLTMKPGLPAAERLAVRALEVSLSLVSRAVIAVSDQEAAHLAALGIARRKIFVVPNGVAAVTGMASMRAQARMEMGVSDQEVVVGFVGRLEPQKRVDLLLRALARIPARLARHIRIAIIGSGSLAAPLERLSAELGILDRVIRLGEVERGDAYMSGFDVFALTSDYEAMPYVLLEAAAAGRPVVATRAGGIESAVADGRNGLVVDSGDVGGISRALTVLAANGELRSRMSAEAFAVGGRFSVDRMVRQTIAVYAESLSGIRR